MAFLQIKWFAVADFAKKCRNKWLRLLTFAKNSQNHWMRLPTLRQNCGCRLCDKIPPPFPEFKPEEDELNLERAAGAATTSKHMGRFFAGWNVKSATHAHERKPLWQNVKPVTPDHERGPRAMQKHKCACHVQWGHYPAKSQFPKESVQTEEGPPYQKNKIVVSIQIFT